MADLQEAGFPLDRWDEVKGRPQDFRLLERVPWQPDTELPILLADPEEDDRYLILLDTETTGVDKLRDDIVELGMLAVRYRPRTGEVVMISAAYQALEEPSVPISAQSMKIHGITPEMVAGQRMDDAAVAAWMQPASLVISHNAGFDRAFFDRRFPELAEKNWACSFLEMPWRDVGFESGKLEYLLYRSGYFYEGHRALVDCYAMAWLFYVRPELLAGLLEKARRKTVVVRAWQAPVAVKDRLKARGYRWNDGSNGANRHWWREVDMAALDEEKAFLDEAYEQGSERAGYDVRDASRRFRME